MIISRNPYDETEIERYTPANGEAVQSALEQCAREQTSWARTPLSERTDGLRRLAGVLELDTDRLAQWITREMGKPITEARAEVEKCAWVCNYYADEGPGFLAGRPVQSGATESYVAFRPLGVILAIMPWNFPFWQVFRFLAPALMAGNGAVLKHANNVTGCALEIMKLVEQAGFPKNLFQTLVVTSDQVEGIIENPLVRGVTLTGSERAGRKVASQAGAALKKCVLELGGSDAYLILEDADLDRAAELCARSRLRNNGQSCIAAKRFIVVESCREKFESTLLKHFAAAVMGDPMDAETTIGPLARVDLREELHRQVEESVRNGAQLLTGGVLPEGPGFYYPPTLLTDVAPGMPAFDEETFGPAGAVVPARDEADAIHLANQTAFGLGSAVMTRDVERGRRIAEYELQAGSCFVNAVVKSDPRLPFGGIKNSGFGRELSQFGMHEFVNIKTIYMA